LLLLNVWSLYLPLKVSFNLLPCIEQSKFLETVRPSVTPPTLSSITSSFAGLYFLILSYSSFHSCFSFFKLFLNNVILCFSDCNSFLYWENKWLMDCMLEFKQPSILFILYSKELAIVSIVLFEMLSSTSISIFYIIVLLNIINKY